MTRQEKAEAVKIALAPADIEVRCQTCREFRMHRWTGKDAPGYMHNDPTRFEKAECLTCGMQVWLLQGQKKAL